MKGKINNLWQTMTSSDFLPMKGGLQETCHLMLRWSVSPAITNGRSLTALLCPLQLQTGDP